MDKRYQVFVSSTYEDLRAERQEVIHALLELDCIPSGMELFPAANEDQWTLIKKVIDECDYYLVISGGRYGSIGPQGYGYTELEYRYATEAGKPVIAFLHKDPQQLPAARVEQTDDGRKRLQAFRDLLQQRMCKFWESSAELGSVVSRSLVRLTKSTPAVGWIRTDEATDALAAAEVLRLRRTIEELEMKLQNVTLAAPAGSDKLAQGDDTFTINFAFDSTDGKGQSWSWTYEVDIAWNDIFYEIGPLMLDDASDEDLERELNRVVDEYSDEKQFQECRTDGQPKTTIKRYRTIRGVL